MARMRKITLIGAVLVLAGCGAEEPASKGGKADLQDAALEFARCMRDQGLDFPDPRPDGDGGVQIGGPNVGDRDPRKMERAHEACEKHLDAVEPPELTSAEKAEMKEQALRHSRCMREQGLDFPDPQFSEDGGAMVKIGPGSGLDPRSPKFQRAQKVCAKEFKGGPRGGGVRREVSP